MSFPPAARANINWSVPTVAATRVNGHMECRWNQKTGVWSEPVFVENPMLTVHGLGTVFQYGQAVYEGMKAFRVPDNRIRIFRPTAHAARLNHSASLVSIPPVPEALFLRAVQLAVGHNADLVPPAGADAMLYIRPFAFGSGPWFLLSPTDEYMFCVYVAPFSALHGVQPLDALILDAFDRAAPRGVGSGKVGGNYAPVMRWSDQAKRDGYPITLHLDSATRSEIEEFSSSAFVGIHGDGGPATTVVVPDSTNIVGSITSDSLTHMAQSIGWRVERRAIPYTELPTFTEVLACGTGVTMVPIQSITRKSTDDKFLYPASSVKAGPCAQRLGRLLDDVYKGKSADPFGWMVTVQDPAVLEMAI